MGWADLTIPFDAEPLANLDVTGADNLIDRWGLFLFLLINRLILFVYLAVVPFQSDAATADAHHNHRTKNGLSHTSDYCGPRHLDNCALFHVLTNNKATFAGHFPKTY